MSEELGCDLLLFMRGFHAAAGKRGRHVRMAGRQAGDVLDEVLATDVTALTGFHIPRVAGQAVSAPRKDAG